jgi:CheY-like chemotaxis protein
MKKDKCILVIEDESYMVNLVAEVLEEEGYTVVTASHPGLGASRAPFADCIVLDLSFSPNKLEGAGIMSHVWDDSWCAIPIIVFSGVVGTIQVDETLHQIENVCGKDRSIFRCVPKRDGIEALVRAVNDWYETCD